MTNRWRATLRGTLASLAFAAPAAADVTSDFASNADGWTVSSGGSLAWVASGGNPSGHIQLTDTATGLYTLDAPAAFVGDLSAYDGGMLSLDLSLVFDNGGTVITEAGQLTVFGPGGAGSVALDVVCTGPSGAWTTITVPFSANAFGISQASWEAILADVNALTFVPDFLNFTGDIAGVDNIALTAPTGECEIVDFEDAVVAGCGIDDAPLTTRYRAQCGVVFGIDSTGDGFIDANQAPRVEASGGIGDGPVGFFNNELGQVPDTADPGFESQLGGYLLRGEVPLAPVTLIILYDAPVAAASAQIWDIDFGASEGTEQWRVEALGFDYSTGANADDIVATRISPEGVDLALDGRPWTFSFDRPTAEIYALRLVHIGSDTTGVGLAFDNFSPSNPAPVPALGPAGIAILACALSAVGAIAHRGGRS